MTSIYPPPEVSEPGTVCHCNCSLRRPCMLPYCQHCNGYEAIMQPGDGADKPQWDAGEAASAFLASVRQEGAGR